VSNRYNAREERRTRHGRGERRRLGRRRLWCGVRRRLATHERERERERLF
jgi:hypothetical protein